MLSASEDSGTGGGVAWWAHIGGFAAGAAIAFVCRNETEAKIFDDGSGELRLLRNDELAEELINKIEEQKQEELPANLGIQKEPELPPNICPSL